jgi:hypothetical protein
MAKIIDPDALSRGTEIDYGTTGSVATGEKSITLRVAGNLDDNSPGKTSGTTLQAVYSKCKELWQSQTDLNKLKFPLKAITEVKFDIYNGWVWFDQQTKDLLRDGGWSYLSSSANIITQQYMGVSTLGSFASGSHKAYIQQVSLNNGKTGPTASIDKTGEVNEPIFIYNNGVFNYRTFFKIFLRERTSTAGYSYAESDLLTDQDLTTLTYALYKIPLSNASDPKISETDTNISSSAPYKFMAIDYLSGSIYETYVPPNINPAKTYYPWNVVYSGSRWYRMKGTAASSGGNPNPSSSLEWQSFPGEKQIGTAYYAFDRIVSGSGGTVQKIYEWLQWQLRQNTNINDNLTGDGYGYITGSTADLFATFVGDNMNTKPGVAINGFDLNDTNNLTQYDITVNTSGSTSTARVYPFVSAGTIVFNSVLIGDASSAFKMYFLNDDAGVNLGRDYDTINAMIVSKSDGLTPITGSVVNGNMITNTTFTYDYDFNVQRGSSSSGSNAPVVVAASGLSSAEWVFAQFTITRATGLNFPVNAAEERNYANP